MESWQKTALGIKLCTLQNEENSWEKKRCQPSPDTMNIFCSQEKVKNGRMFLKH